MKIQGLWDFSMLTVKSFPTFYKIVDTFLFIDKKSEKRMLGPLKRKDEGSAVHETIGPNVSSETT